jgi:hypothetical protein
MRCLPFSITKGALFAEVLRDAARDPSRTAPCGFCAARIVVEPENPVQTVRCPSCIRWQQVTLTEERPWHLRSDAVEALRRTKSWARRI